MQNNQSKDSDPQSPVKEVGGVAPFGYKWLEGQLLVDEEEAPIRRLIYELFLKHKRKKTVARILNETGHRTRKGARFSDTTIDRLIRDSTAKGIRTVKGRAVTVDPIVETAIWERANNILGKTRKPAKQSATIFSGLVFCNCGKPMVRRKSAKTFSCALCGTKIETSIIEEAFAERNSAIILSGRKDSIGENWNILTKREKQIVAENLINRIVIERDTIRFEYRINTNSFKTAFEWQQNRGGTEVPAGGYRKSELEEPLLSETEAAQLLGISRMTLHRWRKANKIKYFQVGSRILYSKEKHLNSFLRDREK